jgi:lysophospholipase L1-like esterase
MKQTIFILAVALAPSVLTPGSLEVAVSAQLVEDFNPPKSNCCLASTAQTLANQLLDWNQLGRYHADNEKLKGQNEPQRVVFMGDSITDAWRLTQYFPGKPYVNRGISGQTTAQMLVRMFEDVIDLKPAAVIIFAGTNDVARNNGPQTIEMVEENFMAMTELAQAHGIKVILCALSPVSDYTPQKKTDGRPPADILKLNTWLKEYAGRNHAVYADYFAALADDKGMLKDGFSRDGLHPNEKGYELMAPVAAGAIQQALGK